jgi:hypothetical protein
MPAGGYLSAYDYGTGNVIDKVLKVGHTSSNTQRTITINTVIYVQASFFAGASQWVYIGIISDATFRPANAITFYAPGYIDATLYKNASGSGFSGAMSYTKMHVKILPAGTIYVWVEGVGQYPTLLGVQQMIFPIHVSYFRIS